MAIIFMTCRPCLVTVSSSSPAPFGERLRGAWYWSGDENKCVAPVNACLNGCNDNVTFSTVYNKRSKRQCCVIFSQKLSEQSDFEKKKQ